MNPVYAAPPRLVASTDAVPFPRIVPDFDTPKRRLPIETILPKDIEALRRGTQALRDGRLTGTESSVVRDAFKAVYEIDANLTEALKNDFLGSNRKYLFEGDGQKRTLETMKELQNLREALGVFGKTNTGPESRQIPAAREAIARPLERMGSIFEEISNYRPGDGKPLNRWK